VGLLTEQERQRYLVFENDEYQDDCYNDENQVESGIVVPDELDELQALTDEERRTKFQAQYRQEMARQRQLFALEEEQRGGANGVGLPQLMAESNSSSIDTDDNSVMWEDG
jgi:hypothetical protein